MAAHSIPERQRAWLAAHGPRSRGEREQSLRILLDGLERHEAALLDALHADLGKTPEEAYSSEIHLIRQELRHALRHLKGWMKPERRRVPAMAWPGRASLHRDACGSVLIIGPWNYPLQLLLTPLVSVIAAGNSAVLKPSEYAPATSRAVASLIGDCFDELEVALVEGGADESQALVAQPFDHIMFTGGTGTGRKIAATAGERLIPVTLELGGKCPALVFPAAAERGGFEAGLEVIARRIAWGKYLNAGQTCVAPDHVLVERGLLEPLMAALAKAFDNFGRTDFGRMVNRQHFDRVLSYLKEGRIVYGGGSDAETLRIEPTLITDLPPGAKAMEEEIFGPVLPVIPCDGLDEALERVRGMPSPLALYAFTRDKTTQDHIASRTSSGSLCFNDTILQITGTSLPFGGVGASGMGRYRGRAGFEAFTRERSVLKRGLRPDFDFRYPPAKLPIDKMRRVFKFLERI
ncbi:aldehyde dehydrogenase family protein [Luteolibacter sp. GHJ8]|uniref:Aldehyde dehydrogenase n=1 Tax=Luteolibacter rhizosphaerae TaxID=2989719 RepID=A0ABT3G8U5_9BACT|nr:aldehyde dehydrogenase family protein [Luteolibacter rhizosphaerae]MCW1916263.1 aldehyde dehydrogenase family protein [Luteolibacter rhizosphaerae]